MKTSTKILLTTSSVALLSIPVGLALMPGDPHIVEHLSTLQVALFLGVSLAEGVGLGLAVSLLAYGLPMLRRLLPESRGLAIASYASITWILGSWWLHDGLHRITPHDHLNQLLGIEYGFHVSLIGTGVVLARAFWKVASRAPQPATEKARLPLGEPHFGPAGN
jgi:hypothetical protein